MGRLSFRWFLVAWLFLLSASGFAVSPTVIERAWRPPVELAGEGNAGLALERFRGYLELQHLVMNHTEFHDDTRHFIDGLWASFERFDLHRFYRLLPEARGKDRILRIYGYAGPDQYHLAPAPRRGVTPPAQPLAGDFEARISARQVRLPDASHYLLNGELALGVGSLTWPAILQASEEALQLMGPPDPMFMGDHSGDARYYRNRVRAMSPGLSREDIALIAPLWAAYPEVWNVAARIGRIERLLDPSVTDAPLRRFKASFVIEPQRLKTAYPHLAWYLQRLGSLFRVQIELDDEHGRLIELDLDSETLRAEIEMVVRDGQLVPLVDGEPRFGTPAFNHSESRQMQANINIRMNILGIIAEVQSMQATIAYTPGPAGARFDAAIRSVPEVAILGRALGVVPPGLINVFMPRPIDQLVTDFLTVAALGNNGQGMTGSAAILQGAAGGHSRLEASAAFEGLDNFLVRVGMGIVNSRVIPDPEESEDIRRLLSHLHQAFARDLDRFERLQAAPGRETLPFDGMPGKSPVVSPTITRM